MPLLTANSLTSKSSPLLRQLGFYSATALVVSNMVGTGIFTTTGFMAGDLGSAPLILWCWAVGAFFAICGALSYSELGINFPSSGGEYVYLSEGYGPAWGFMSGWVSFFAGFSAPIAAAALAFAYYTGYFNPAFKQDTPAWFSAGTGALSLRIGGPQALAASLIALFTILNCLGVKPISRIQNVLTGTKVVVIATFILVGLVIGQGSWGHFSQEAVRTSSSSLPVQFIISLVWVMVGYSGWNAATYVAEEIRTPQKNLPAAIAVGTTLVTLMYLGLNIVFIYAAPLEKMKGVPAIGSLAASELFGPGIAGAFAGLMAISIVSTVNAMITIGPRVYYAMAKNHAFFATAARVNPRFRTPIAAIVAQGICAIVMTMTPFPQLVLYIGFSLTFFTVLAVGSVFIFRRRTGWQQLNALNFAWPAIPVAYILIGVTTIGYGFVFAPVPSGASLATIVVGAMIYRLVWKKHETALRTSGM
jgi:APA family basic amino acid/polyamine antiporter